MPAKKAATKSKTAKRKSATTKKTTSPKKRATTKKKTTTKAGDREVTIDRRRKADRRDEQKEKGAAKGATATPPAERREKVQRRRQIDPTTCERDYSDAEVEFMNAMDEYKRTSGRMFPTCSEVLEVIRNLGYTQLTPAELATVRPEAKEEQVSEEDDQQDFEGAELEVEELAC